MGPGAKVPRLGYKLTLKVTTFWAISGGLKSVKDLGFGTQKKCENMVCYGQSAHLRILGVFWAVLGVSAVFYLGCFGPLLLLKWGLSLVQKYHFGVQNRASS